MAHPPERRTRTAIHFVLFAALCGATAGLGG